MMEDFNTIDRLSSISRLKKYRNDRCVWCTENYTSRADCEECSVGMREDEHGEWIDGIEFDVLFDVLIDELGEIEAELAGTKSGKRITQILNQLCCTKK